MATPDLEDLRYVLRDWYRPYRVTLRQLPGGNLRLTVIKDRVRHALTFPPAGDVPNQFAAATLTMDGMLNTGTTDKELSREFMRL